LSIRRILCAAILAISSEAHADAVSEGFELARSAIEAQEKGDVAAAADLFRAALQRRPNHPGLTLRLAGATLKAGRNEEAVAALEDYAALGLNADLGAETWKPLSTHPRWQALLARFAANAKPVGSPRIVATIDEPDLIAEGLALDRAENRLYVGSVHKRKIVAIKDGRTTIVAERNGLLGVFALAWAGNQLWAASSALPQVVSLTSDEKGRAGLFAFDKTGRQQRRVMLPADGKEHVLGDLATARNGDIYTSDSNGTTIYRLRANVDALEIFHASDELHSPQGLALSDREDKLALADYSSGIHVIDVATGARRVLAMPAHTTLHGVDAVVRHGRDLICVQNGIDPQRVIRVRLNEGWDEIEGIDVLAANLPEMSEPTLAVRDAGTGLLVIGDGQWSRFNDDGTPKASAPQTPTRVLRLVLPAPRT
jgi:tetratricopeptide (TPR) repeat protein